MRRGSLRTKVEEIRQASAIHGGLWKMCVAALGVRLARVPIPSRRLRDRVYRTIYGKKYAALDEAELERPLADYRSFNALFTRGVRPELRPIPTDPDLLLCPCDGRVQEVGRLHRDRILTVKGIEYSVGSLLPAMDTRPFENGHFGIFFLSPADCHRIFSPQDGVVEEIIHVPGFRLLVHPPFQRQEYPVFALNERLILRLRTPLGLCVLVLVAGWGVGNITLPIAPRFRPGFWGVRRQAFTPPLPVTRGQWIATFELGSTAILLTEPTAAEQALVTGDEKLRYGQPVFSRAQGGRPCVQ